MHRLTVLLLALLVAGCAHIGGFGPSSQIPPSDLGIQVSLQELQANRDQYDIYYSERVYNPSAVLFVPKDSEYTLKLLRGWHSADEYATLDDLLFRMDKLKPPHYPRLYALVAPSREPGGERPLLGYIYTPDYASLRKGKEPGTYVLRKVPELFNSIYYGDGDFQNDKH
jgi:hypothetical protein